MADLQKSVEKFASDLGEKIESFIDDVSSLEVRTYTTPTDQVETLVKSEADLRELIEAKAALRAYTCVSFDGDTTIWIPADASGGVDTAIWDLHQSIVAQAIANRTSMIESMGKAAKSALDALNAGGT